MVEEEKKGFWSKLGNSIEKVAKKSGTAISKAAKVSFDKTNKAFAAVGDTVFNSGLCYQCKAKADIPINCKHILCARCARYYCEIM